MSDICLINGIYPPDGFGGAENYVKRVANSLRQRGHNSYVLTTSSNLNRNTLSIQKEIRDGIPVYRFHPLNTAHRSDNTGGNIFSKALWHQLDSINPHANRVVSNFLDSMDPDIVHTNNFMGITASTGRAVSNFDCKYIHTLHDYSLICPKSNLLRDMTLPDDEIAVCENPPAPCQLYAKIKDRVIGQPDLVISPSQHVISVHNKHGFFSDCPTSRIQHGVTDVANTVPDKPSNQAVLYVGKHLRAKGLETLLEAARQLADITIHLCGTGPHDDKSKAVAAELDNVEYHGYVSNERLKQLRRRVAAAVVPSIWMENSPLTIYESFAQGLPVIGSDVGGIPELVNDSRGWLFEPGNSVNLAENIREAVTEEQQHRQYEALSWAADHSMQRHIDKLEEVYAVENQ